MSMFNRKIKMQFNRVKYSPLLADKSYLLTHYVPKENVIKSRILLFLLGWGCTSGMLNYDATIYKMMKGINRWKHNLSERIYGHGHGHGHGDNHGHDDHGNSHNHSADKHAGDNHSSKHENHKQDVSHDVEAKHHEGHTEESH